MKPMWTVLLLAGALPAAAAEPPDAAAALTGLLRVFLAGVDSLAVHDAFWADDLIYTGSSGRRIGKEDILREMREAPPPSPGDPVTTYGAEEIRIREYGNTAVMAFRLVATTTQRDGRVDVLNFFNTGTFVRRDGAWKAVAWQATRIPLTEAEAETTLAAAHASFREALRGSDARAVGTLLDDRFAWTRGADVMSGKERFMHVVDSGALNVAALAAEEGTASVYGETGVVRGPAYTLVFAREGGAWKAVALHTYAP
jgi:ketosteroid isomerase-like protein